MFSLYNEMLGEFYIRGFLHLWLLSRDFDWVKEAQLYLHMHSPYRSLLDSHHLFTSALRTKPLLDFAVLLNEPTCTCLPRVIFCEYDVVPTPEEPGVLQLKLSSGPEAEGTMLRDFRNFLRNSTIESNRYVQADIQAYRD